MACSADLRNTQKQERRTNNPGEPEPPQQQQTKEQNSNMQNTEHHKRQQQGQERRHLGVEKAPPNATKMRPTGPPNLSLFRLLWKLFFEPLGAHFGPPGAQSWLLGLLGAPFGAPGGYFWASSGRVPGGGGKGAKRLQNGPK